MVLQKSSLSKEVKTIRVRSTKKTNKQTNKQTKKGGDWESLLTTFLNCQTQSAGVGVNPGIFLVLMSWRAEMPCL